MAIGDQADEQNSGVENGFLKAALVERDAKITELTELVAKLSAQVEQLTELLGQNSKNSHLPPSSDGPGSSAGGGAAGTRRPKPKRKRGGQKGHRGSHRQLLPVERVDAFIDLFPEVCLGCTREVPELSDACACRYQQLDLRNRRPHLTEWRRHEVDCEHCGSSTRAAHKGSKIPTSAFGPELTAAVVLLTGVYHLSRRKTQRLLFELLGVSASLGAVSAMEQRASEALKSSHEEALREVQHAAVKHTDATSWARAGKLMSLWTLASVAATVYQIFPDGRRDTIVSMFGRCLGLLVSDRASVFGFWTMALRQICHAHLLRRFVSFSERDGPAGAIGRELLALTKLIFEYWHGFKEGLLTRQELQFWMRPVQRDFERVLERAVASDIARLSGSCKDILAHRDALWTFVEQEGVEPTNNHAELELRDLVLWRKRSFGSQSERGERFAERVMTAVRTARKQGKGVLDFLARSMTAYVDGTLPPRLIESRTTP